jgi:hypothetical protein
LKNGLFRGEIFFSRKKNHPSEGQFFKNDKICNSYESRSVSARAESYKKVRKQILTKNFFTSPCFLGSGIRDPGSGIRDGKKPRSGIRDKHPGSATLCGSSDRPLKSEILTFRGILKLSQGNSRKALTFAERHAFPQYDPQKVLTFRKLYCRKACLSAG